MNNQAAVARLKMSFSGHPQVSVVDKTFKEKFVIRFRGSFSNSIIIFKSEGCPNIFLFHLVPSVE
jgi:hypothetical protein